MIKNMNILKYFYIPFYWLIEYMHQIYVYYIIYKNLHFIHRKLKFHAFLNFSHKKKYVMAKLFFYQNFFNSNRGRIIHSKHHHILHSQQQGICRYRMTSVLFDHTYEYKVYFHILLYSKNIKKTQIHSCKKVYRISVI
jgi:hypothetical protein